MLALLPSVDFEYYFRQFSFSPSVSASMGVFIILFDKSFCELKLNFQIRVEILDVEPF